MHCHRTPLHCAVAYCNLEVIRYLIEHGASLFLMTSDGDTPLAIAQEELKLVKAQQPSDADVLTSAAECLKSLQGQQVQHGHVQYVICVCPMQIWRVGWVY